MKTIWFLRTEIAQVTQFKASFNFLAKTVQTELRAKFKSVFGFVQIPKAKGVVTFTAVLQNFASKIQQFQEY